MEKTSSGDFDNNSWRWSVVVLLLSLVVVVLGCLDDLTLEFAFVTVTVVVLWKETTNRDDDNDDGSTVSLEDTTTIEACDSRKSMTT